MYPLRFVGSSPPPPHLTQPPWGKKNDSVNNTPYFSRQPGVFVCCRGSKNPPPPEPLPQIIFRLCALDPQALSPGVHKCEVTVYFFSAFSKSPMLLFFFRDNNRESSNHPSVDCATRLVTYDPRPYRRPAPVPGGGGHGDPGYQPQPPPVPSGGGRAAAPGGRGSPLMGAREGGLFFCCRYFSHTLSIMY